MPNAKETFEISIKDATLLLDHFKAINTLSPPHDAEVLKRASLIMACTAWETYVEDRVRETVTWLLAASPSFQNEFIDRHLQNERARKDLDTLIKKRGEAVHRSKAPSAGVPAPHLITKDQLETATRLVVSLVEATDKATALPVTAQGRQP